MLKSTQIKVVLALALTGIVSGVSANSRIINGVTSKGIILRTTPVCLTCHTSPGGGSATVRPSVRAAYILDTINLSRLINLLKGCPAGTGLNSAFLCANVPATETLGLSTSGTAATDVYEVVCGTGTTQLHALVRDAAPVNPSLLAIQINRGNRASFLNIDPVDGDALPSAAAILGDGFGRYTVNVSKLATSVKGAEVYVASFACRNATGVLMPTSVSLPPRQDQ